MVSSPITIKVCTGHACSKNFSAQTLERAKAEKELHDYSNIQLETCPCQGKCAQGPTVVVEQDEKKEVHLHMMPVEMGKLMKKLAGREGK